MSEYLFCYECENNHSNARPHYCYNARQVKATQPIYDKIAEFVKANPELFIYWADPKEAIPLIIDYLYNNKTP